MAVIWACIDGNAFDIIGPRHAVKELTSRRLFLNLKNYHNENGIDQSPRLQTQSEQMVGTRAHKDLKTKAGETGILVEWATKLAEKKRGRAPIGEELVAAGQCLLEWRRRIKGGPRVIPRRAQSRLLEISIRHNVLMQQAQIPLSPKRHMWIEMILRLEQCGNPSGYSCFFDESLN
eukprot:5295603-Pyramimonas_sp.AAC.1